MIGLTAVRVVGGLLPPDVLDAVLAGSLDGLRSNDYHLGGESPREAAAREWSYLLGAYRRFRVDLAKLPDGDPAIGVTRERWLTLLLSSLGYGRVSPTGPGGLTVGDKQYPVSHLWGACPLHLLGWGVALDRRSPGVAGAAQRAPHAMVQELLNRTDDYLWALLTNGHTLRLLRDNTTLTGQAYVEFDLETMFDADLFADFALLYLLAHQSRVEVPNGGRPADCWLERWRTTAIERGVRALNLLRVGVHDALATLGTGFLQHPANVLLRADLDTGRITVAELHENLLRIVYRLLFWTVAEDRDALLDPAADPSAAERYRRHFSSARLRQVARQRQGSAHHDLWDATRLVLTALGRVKGEPRLGLPGLGGLFNETAADVLTGAALGNRPFLAAIRSLSIVQPKDQPRRTVDFRQLGAEELGSIYESLLESVPRRDPVSQTFTLEDAAGNDRKTTGSYYTPTALVDLVLDTALDPILDVAEKQSDPETALLAVTCCDPAIGSGHFMVAAARRIAMRLATLRTGEIDPTPQTYTDALHDVIARCIYGVDINPLAADLAKVSLWLEAMSPGRPLSFLDHHIKVGNALLGTTPALLAAGIPDAAYTALTGDDKATVRSWKNQNFSQRSGQFDLLDQGAIDVGNARQRVGTAEVAERAATATTLSEMAWAAQRYATLQADDKIVRDRRVADAWCAAFLTPKTADSVRITGSSIIDLASGSAAHSLVAAVDALAARHRLFHWHLEFPDIFRVTHAGPANTPTGWSGGFSAMLGNPPWERVKLQEQEFFAAREPAIANAKNAAARKKAIASLASENPALLIQFEAAKRISEVERQFLRTSGRFPLCGVGDVNTYSVFAEHFRTCLAYSGQSGIVTPTGLATDATTSAFFADTLRTQRLVAFYDFENEAKIFEGVDHRVRFSISSMTGGESVPEVRLAFLNRQVADATTTRFELSSSEVLLVNPNTGTLPVFRTRRDAEITLGCYRRHPVLIRDRDVDGNPWDLRFGTLFHMANDSDKFHPAGDLESDGAVFDGWAWRRGEHRWLPLYEAKMLSHWNQRFSTYENATQAQLNVGSLPRLSPGELNDSYTEPVARYWVDEEAVTNATPPSWDRDWFLGWRDIARASDVRSFVPSVLPKAAVGHVFPVAFPACPEHGATLQAIWSSLIFDYLARQKLSGTHMTYGIVNQLACPIPTTFATVPGWSDEALADYVKPRVLELTYTSYRIAPYAKDIVNGDPSEPFHWIPERRAQLAAELDAAMLHAYGLDRSDAEHVLDSFPVLRRYEERDHGEFRTRRLVLTEYDAMTRAAETSLPYRSPLDPPPGYGPRHPARQK